MSSLEFNKIIAAILTAGVIALACGFVAELLLPAAKPLEQQAYVLAPEEPADAEAEAESGGAIDLISLIKLVGDQKVSVRAINYRNQGFDHSSGAFGIFLLSRQDEKRNEAVCEAVFRLVGSAGESGVAVEQQRITYWLDSREQKVTAARGEKTFKKCAACHAVEAGAPHKIGPNLWNVVGSAIAGRAGYAYSEALTSLSDQTWSYQTLDRFLTNPKAFAAGTKMAFAGLRKPEERRSLILYLRDASDQPLEPPPVLGGPAAAENCAQRVANYDFDRADGVLAKLDKQGSLGPVFAAWDSTTEKVLALDLSSFAEEDLARAVTLWKQRIVQNPEVWNDGIDIALVKEEARNFLRRYGDSIMGLFDIKAFAKE